jgi:hypothetical protein
VTARKSHQSSEYVVEASSHRRFDIRKVTERGPHLEAREHFAQRTERGVVARCPVSTARIRALCNVEGSTAKRSLALPGEIRIAPLELLDERPDETNELQEHWVDSQHDETPC